MVKVRARGGSENGTKRLQQVEEADFDLSRCLGGGFRARTVRPVNVASQQSALGQGFRGLFVALVFKQASHQFGPGIDGFFIRAVALPGQEHPALDQSQGRGHQEVLARHIDIQILHHLDVGEVLLADLGDGDIDDFDFVLPNQVEQEIQRPLEKRQLDRIGCVGIAAFTDRWSAKLAMGITQGHSMETPRGELWVGGGPYRPPGRV